jgi:hypothetical protein
LSFSHLGGGWVEIVLLWSLGKRCGDQLGVRQHRPEPKGNGYGRDENSLSESGRVRHPCRGWMMWIGGEDEREVEDGSLCLTDIAYSAGNLTALGPRSLRLREESGSTIAAKDI